jgi:hypothetical protein
MSANLSRRHLCVRLGVGLMALWTWLHGRQHAAANPAASVLRRRPARRRRGTPTAAVAAARVASGIPTTPTAGCSANATSTPAPTRRPSSVARRTAPSP